MYSKTDNQMLLAPPPYSEPENTHKYMASPQQVGPSNPPPPGVQQPTQVIMVQAPAIPPLGSESVRLTCPSCETVVISSVTEEASNTAYLCCILMCGVGCFLCSCLPFCMDNFKIFKHSCPRCTAFIGSYRP